MAVTVYQQVYTQIEKGIDKVLIGGLEKIAAYLTVPLTAAFVLYIIIYGISIMRGQVQEPLNEGIKRLLKLAFIWYVAINPDIFTEFFDNVFRKFLPNEVIKALLGTPAGSPAGSLDAFINWGFLTGERVIKESGWVAVGSYILAGIIFMGTVIAGCAAFLIAAMALIVLGVLLVVGPIFVSFMLFEATNRWFWSWLSNLFSFAFMQILLVALLMVAGGVIETLYDAMIAKVDLNLLNDHEKLLYTRYGISRVSNAAAFGILTVYVITIFLFKKIPELTSNISGGISVGLGGFADSAKNSLTKPFTAPYKAVKGYVGGISKGTNKVIDYLTTKNTSPSPTQSGSANTSQASSSSANSIKPIGLSGSQSSSGSAGSPVPYNMYVSYGSSGLAGSAKSAGLSSSTKIVSPPRSDRYPQPAALSDSSGSSGSSPAPALYGPSGSSGSSSSSGEAPSSAGSTQSAGSSSSSATPASSGSSGASGSSESSSSSSGTST